MVYKIVGEINNNFGEIVNELMEFNRIIVKNGSIYIAFNDYKGYDEYRERVDKLKDIWIKKNILVLEMNENNLKNEEQEIMEWCRDNFVRLEREKFQEENQDRLHYMNNFLDIFEENLRKIEKKEAQNGSE